MVEALSTRTAEAADNPETSIPCDRRQALSAGPELLDGVAGTVLFADISSFTPLTEALAAELGPEGGAEVARRSAAAA